jgi:outer membrane receptor for ferrienterochelin and colicins
MYLHRNLNKLSILLIALCLSMNLLAQESTQEPVKDSTSLLNMSLEELLNASVITVSKSAEKQSDAPGIISVITGDDLERFGGTTLKDILERVPGLISTCTFFADPTLISARGDQIKNTSSHVLMLINGRPARETQDGGINSEMYNAFPVDVIERIEVIKGPGSVLYGSDAFSAVVNIITKKAEGTNVSVSGTGTADGGYGSSGIATIKLGELGIVAGGRYLKKDWDASYETTDQMTQQDTTTTLNAPDKSTGGYLGIKYKGLNLMSSYNKWETKPVNGGSGEGYWEKLFTNLGYSAIMNPIWSMDINAGYTQTTDDISIAKKTSYNILAEWTNFVTISDKSKLVIGGLFNRVHGKETSSMASTGGGLGGGGQTSSEESVIANGNKNNFAFYAQVDYRLLDNLKLIGGAQANKAENIDLNIVPRAGVIWYPVPRLNVKALYSSAFRAPSISELTLNSDGIKGSSGLTPEKVATIDIGLSYQGEKAQVGVNVFRSKMTDIISVVNQLYTNNASIIFRGIEFSGAYYLNRSLYLNASLIYQENENDTVKNVSYIANFGAKAGISYVWNKGIPISLFNIYQGKMADKYAGNLDDNGNKLAYDLLHLHSQYNINTLLGFRFRPEIFLFFDVDNLLDQKYYAFSSGNSSSTAIPRTPGMEIFFGLNATF